MVYGSVCSGIEAATCAWHPLGWKAAWFSEIEKFPSRVLKHHYPCVPNLGDMLKLETNEHFKSTAIDLLVGGTPCTSFSLAGLRGGLDDHRGNLALEFCRLLIAKRPRWFVWENVPGVFSSFSDEAGSKRYTGSGCDGTEFDITQTADFATLLTAFSECGYSCAWAVLDSQYFGVPQRRRRVFVVGYFGSDWRPPAAVLFERESLSGHPAPGKKKREDLAGTLDASSQRSRGAGTNPGLLTVNSLTTRAHQDRGDEANLIAYGGNSPEPLDTSTSLMSKGYRQDFESDTLIVGTLDSRYAHGQGATGQDSGHGHSHLIPMIYPHAQITSPNNRSNPKAGDPSPTLSSGGQQHIVTGSQPAASVRRLTPLEFERLQGFEDGYTDIPGATDAARYKALGNSMTVNVMAYIGGRIDKVDKLLNKRHGKKARRKD